MTTLAAGLKLDFAPHWERNREPFALQAAVDPGGSPVQVRPFTVPAWTLDPTQYEGFLDQALVMEESGRRRVRLYCADALAGGVRLLVLGGAHRNLGRRQEPMLEILSWTQAATRRLRFHHDQPAVRLVDRTAFYNDRGEEVGAPEYDQASGAFHHPQEVTGALLVEYRPGFTLYEIEYDTGAAQIPPEWFREMKLAWLAGNIHQAAIPPVRVIAIGTRAADQISFAREFWPYHSSVLTGFRSVRAPTFETTDNGYKITPKPLDDPCWQRCKEMIRPNDPYLTAAELVALHDCVQRGKNPKFQYVEESRSVRVERLFAPDNPEVWLDVARPVELVMKLQRADSGVCDGQAPSGCCPELRLRFSEPE
ncbi:MAG: hypothetical protein HQM03_11890 [Magnetococcales bacterium]|nr:hypothetical protein [Magnetococcales bacterium]